MLVLWLTTLYILWLSIVLSILSDLAITEAVDYEYGSLVIKVVFQLHNEWEICSCFNSWAKNAFIYFIILFITKQSCRCDILLPSLLKSWLSKKTITFILYICFTLYIYVTIFVICTWINIFNYFESFFFFPFHLKCSCRNNYFSGEWAEHNEHH